MRLNRITGGACALAAVICSASAEAALYQWSWTRPSQEYIEANSTAPHIYSIPNGQVNDLGGVIHSISTSFDTDSNHFSYSVTLGDQPVSPDFHTPNAFWLVVTPGPLPVLPGGQVAQLYFDASGDSPILTGYAYNGGGDATSFFDGSLQNGIQPPDRLFSSLNDPGMILDLSVVENADQSTTFSFTIDATSIMNHTPMYPWGGEWTGVSFGEQIGIWMHPVTNLSSRYENGYLSEFTYWGHGWFDMENIAVPAPSALALLAAAGLLGRSRRR